MPDSIDFGEGARRLRNFVSAIPDFIEDELDYIRQQAFFYQVANFHDAPHESPLFKDWFGPPLRSLTTRLYWSLRGYGHPDKIEGYFVPVAGRTNRLTEGGKIEHIREFNVGRSKGTLKFGTRVPYARRVERGLSGKIAPHPFFFSGAQKGFDEATKDTGKAIRDLYNAKLGN